MINVFSDKLRLLDDIAKKKKQTVLLLVQLRLVPLVLKKSQSLAIKFSLIFKQSVKSSALLPNLNRAYYYSREDSGIFLIFMLVSAYLKADSVYQNQITWRL